MAEHCEICDEKIFRGRVCKECEDSLLNLTLEEMDKNPATMKEKTMIDGKLIDKPEIDETDIELWGILNE